MLSPTSWDPRKEGLWQWLAGKVAREFPGLMSTRTYGPNAPTRLVLERRILPVLDGIDELQDLLPDAVRAVAAAVGDDLPVVVTCRTQEYEATVLKSGRKFATAEILELEPVRGDNVIEYLRSATAARWDEVAEHLRSRDENDALVVALSSPLNVWLTRVAYASVYSTPADLTDARRFPNPDTVEAHLMQQLIPQTYQVTPPLRPTVSGSKATPAKRYTCTPQQAQRWLTYLAKDMSRRPGTSNDIAWWSLDGSGLRLLSSLVLGSIAAFLGGVGLAFSMGFGAGLLVGPSTTLLLRPLFRRKEPRADRGFAGPVITGLLGALIGALLSHIAFTDAREIVTVTSSTFRVLAFGLAVAVLRSPLAGFAGGVAAGFAGEAVEYHANPGNPSIATHVICGLGIGLLVALAAGVVNRRAPAMGWGWSVLGSLCGMAVGLAAGIAVWLQAGVPAGIAVGLAGILIGPYVGGRLFTVVGVDGAIAASPDAVLKNDRTTFLAGFFGLGAAMGIGNGLQVAFSPDAAGGPKGAWVGVETGVLNLLIVGLMFGFLQARWGSFALARCWLAARSCLPWRLMSFLADARERGILRQAGAVYRFRHNRLQEYLTRLRL